MQSKRHLPPNLAGLAAFSDTLVGTADIGGGRTTVGLDVGQRSGVTPVGVDADTFLSSLQAYLSITFRKLGQ